MTRHYPRPPARFVDWSPHRPFAHRRRDARRSPLSPQPAFRVNVFALFDSCKAALAPAYVYFASQESSYVSGEVIGVTGGTPLH
jgi:hypothetical protein